MYKTVVLKTNPADGYGKTLEDRIQKILSDIRTKGIRNHARRDVLTGYSYGEFYDWDLYFENLFLSYFGESTFCRNGVEMFLDTQRENGFVSRTMGLVYKKPTHHFKPFLAQIALLGCRQTGDYRWLSDKYYGKLKKYLDYWFWYCDFDKNGLAVWDGSDHSGMDNQRLRLGYDGVMEFEGADINSYLYRELLAMAELSDELGRGDGKAYGEKASDLADNINKYLWDEAEGFYYDRSEKTGRLNHIKSVAGFIPLWAGIAPKERAERLIREHLLDKESFWLPYPVASWSKKEEGYYQESRSGECTWMGASWVPVNYMVFHGLVRYGFVNEAKELAEKNFGMVMSEPELREYYNGETGSGQGLNPFWGWSSLAYFMPFELDLNYDPTDLKCKEFVKIGGMDINC